MKFLKTAIVTTALVLSTGSNAEIISVDWNNAGDNLITRDLSTGLEWLDLTETAGLTYDFVSSNLGDSGFFDGWAYASTSEVEAFFNSAGGIGPYDYNAPSPFNDLVVQDLLESWGTLHSHNTQRFSNFVTSHIPQIDWHGTGIIYYSTNTPAVGYMDADFTSGGLFNSEGVPNVGHALVRVSAVPIPAAVWLFGSGLIGLIGLARRKKA